MCIRDSVCSVNMSECAGKEAEPEPEETEQPPEEEKGGGMGILLVVLLVAACLLYTSRCV